MLEEPAAFDEVLSPCSAAVPNPCSLVTAAEMQAIVGKLSGTPKATDPASGEITCTFEPVNGPSFIDVSLHDGDLKAWKARNGGKSPVSLPELGADAFANPSDNDWVDLYAKKGAVIVRVTMPTGQVHGHGHGDCEESALAF